MDTPPELFAVVHDTLLAICTSDRALLRTVAIPHPELSSLTSTPRTPSDIVRTRTDLEQLQVCIQSELAGRWFLHVWFGGVVQPMVAVATEDGWRMDLRWSIAAEKPPTGAALAARDFLTALLLGDLEELRRCAVDPSGLELLVDQPPPAGEVAQLVHVAAAMPLIELGIGDVMPDLIGGNTQVSQRHVDAGYVVLLGLFSGGELPFLVKTVDGRPRVSPYHFVRAAAKARGAQVG